MSIDFQWAFNAAMALIVPVGLTLWKMGSDRVERAEKAAAEAASQLAAYKLHVSETYLAIKRFEGFEERLFGELKAIRESLADKQDRV